MVQNLLSDSPHAHFSDGTISTHLIKLLNGAREIADPLDLRVPITRTGMVVGKNTDPVGYHIVAKLRHMSGGANGDRWQPCAGSSVYIIEGPATPQPFALAPGFDGILSSDIQNLLPERKFIFSKVTVVRVAQNASCFLAPLTGAAEIPPVNSCAHGSIWLFLDSSVSRLRYLIIASNIKDVLEVHLHHGLPNANQPPVAVIYKAIPEPDPVFINAGSLGSMEFEQPFMGNFDALASALRNGEVYGNVHTVKYPSGEIRGQFGAY